METQLSLICGWQIWEEFGWGLLWNFLPFNTLEEDVILQKGISSLLVTP